MRGKPERVSGYPQALTHDAENGPLTRNTGRSAPGKHANALILIAVGNKSGGQGHVWRLAEGSGRLAVAQA